ncbi:hypothetical protein [Actinacidiphila acidipaludis]|uniref:Uncharacterized protein n=1 Tax=Actinacidiphila acidipaludis TaxID=2873382 RepID=A0ABS7PYV7_9ACTN|nr:hypothetical protein [Streptomyces acidipaludis]MBY8876070.1 hypothetical protein [Streptomyces acidipaludis]
MEDSELHDVIEALGTLRGADEQTRVGPDTVASDLDRGRRALIVRRRRRTVRTGVAAALVLTAVTVAVVSRPGGSGTGVTAHAPASASVHTVPTVHTVQLVAYTGAQPTGFRVDTVPSGWTVSWSDAFSFVAVPPGTSVHQSADDVRLVPGISVSLQGDAQLDPNAAVTRVTVHGKPGRLALTSDKSAKWLVFSGTKGQDILVQVPVDLGLTDDQIVRFAEGVTATGEARAALG